MRITWAHLMVFSLLFAAVSLTAQDTPVQVENRPKLDSKSYGLIKYKMDSVLYIMLDEYKQLDRTIKGIELEQETDLSDEDKKLLEREHKITKERLKYLTELRKKGINLQLDLSYNRKSYEMGLACAKYLRESFNVPVFPYINTDHQPVVVDNKMETAIEVESTPISYVDILEESKPEYFFKTQPDWTELPISCNFTTNGYDFNTKRKTISLGLEPLFSYTHPKLKPIYKDKDALETVVALTQIEKDYYLNLRVKIRSKDANRSYGLIEKSAVLVMELINDRKEYGRALNKVVGVYDAETKLTTYDIFYQLDKQTLKALSKTEVSAIGIFWSSGYELYNVYEVEVLYNQANCLKKQS